MFRYLAYGLNIHSALPLPELLAADSSLVTLANDQADVTVRFGAVDDLPPEFDGREHYASSTPDATYVAHKDVGAFSIRNGSRIVIQPAPRADERVLRLYLLNSALPFLLHQRGFLVLHASAVAINGAAVAFLGRSGRGKSTMAAALHARGHQVVADDVTAIRTDVHGVPMVYPGVPQLRLWPDSIIALGDAPDALPRLHPKFDKRGSVVLSGFSLQPLHLKRIYLLGEAQAPEIIAASPHDTLIELVRHTYGVRATVGKGCRAANHFAHCAKLSQRLTVRYLKRPRMFAKLRDVARMVEEDLDA